MLIEKLKRNGMAALPLLILTGVGLAVWLWPASGPEESELARAVRPPVAEAGPPIPTTIVSVAQGQPVGDEAYFKGFRLNSGWHLFKTAEFGRYDLRAEITNIEDAPDTAHVLVTIRVADRTADVLMCRVSLEGGQTKPLVCADTHHAPYTSRWGRITITTM